MKWLYQFSNEVAKGNTSSVIVTLASDKDTLHALHLNVLVAILIRIREEDRLRDWLKNGINELNTLMPGEQKTAEMSDNILTFLAKFLKADAGVLDMPDEKGMALELNRNLAFIPK